MKRFGHVLLAAAFVFCSCDKESSTVNDTPSPGDYVDEYGINYGKGISVGGITWAPVNCGYKPATASDRGYRGGKLYQWGRKYGQGYYGDDRKDAGVDYKAEGPLPLEIAASEKYSGVFITSDYDWVDPSDDKLWNDGTEEAPVKSQYDPCPDGWRVPTRAELDKLASLKVDWKVNDKNQLGAWFSDGKATLFLPTTPYRGFRGESYNPPFGGSYWSSLAGWQASGIYLRIGSENTGTYNSGRSNAYAVRCVRVYSLK